MIVSFYLLSITMRSLPLSTAYAIWVVIGAVGAAVAGIMLFQESISALKMLSLLLVIVGIIGLKVSSGT